MAFTKAEKQEAIVTIYSKLCRGKSDREIVADMGISAEEYEELKSAMFDAKADELRGTPEDHMYVRYMIEQNINLKDLTRMIKQFKTTKQYNAMVGAVRARSEILDKIIAKGQEFGLIKKTPSRKEIVAGVLVADMSNQALREGITHAIKNLDRLVREYGGEKDFLELPSPQDLHYGKTIDAEKDETDSVPEETVTELLDSPPTKSAKRIVNKVFKGRRKMPPPPPGFEE